MQKVLSPALQEFRSKPFAYIVQVVGVLVIIANIFIATKLSPIYKSIDEITFKVQNVEAKVSSIDEGAAKLDVIFEKLDNIEARLERIDSRLAKHMGI